MRSARRAQPSKRGVSNRESWPLGVFAWLHGLPQLPLICKSELPRFQPILLCFSTERYRIHPELTGCLAQDALVMAQRRPNQLAFELIHPPFQRSAPGKHRIRQGKALQHVLRENVRKDQLPGRSQEHGALDRVAQLANVARPIVPFERRLCLRAQWRRGAIHRLTESFQEMEGERQNVVSSLLEGRQIDRKGAQSVKEIGPETAGIHFRAQIAVAGCYQANVDPLHFVTAHRPHLAAIDESQEFRLQGWRGVLNFVEKESAPIGDLKEAGTIPDRTGEGAFHVAKKLALQQRFRKNPTVDRDKRSLRARGELVQRPGKQLLPRPGRTLKQNVRSVRGDHLNQGEHRAHRLAFQDHLAQRQVFDRAGLLGRRPGPRESPLQLLAQPPQLTANRVVFAGPLDHQPQPISIHGTSKGLIELALVVQPQQTLSSRLCAVDNPRSKTEKSDLIRSLVGGLAARHLLYRS